MEKHLCSSRRDTNDFTTRCLSKGKIALMQSVLSIINIMAMLLIGLTLAVVCLRQFVSDPTPAYLELAGVIFLTITHIYID